YSGMTTMSFDTADLGNDGKSELYVGQIAMGKMGELPKRLAPPVASCGIYTDMADISRCDALARFQAAVARGRDNWTIELCREVGRGLRRLDLEREVCRSRQRRLAGPVHRAGHALAPVQPFERLLSQRKGRKADRVDAGGGPRRPPPRRGLRVPRLRSGRRS